MRYNKLIALGLLSIGVLLSSCLNVNNPNIIEYTNSDGQTKTIKIEPTKNTDKVNEYIDNIYDYVYDNKLFDTLDSIRVKIDVEIKLDSDYITDEFKIIDKRKTNKTEIIDYENKRFESKKIEDYSMKAESNGEKHVMESYYETNLYGENVGIDSYILVDEDFTDHRNTIDGDSHSVNKYVLDIYDDIYDEYNAYRIIRFYDLYDSLIEKKDNIVVEQTNTNFITLKVNGYVGVENIKYIMGRVPSAVFFNGMTSYITIDTKTMLLEKASYDIKIDNGEGYVSKESIKCSYSISNSYTIEEKSKNGYEEYEIS